MTTRRQLLKTLAALPPVLAMPAGFAQQTAADSDPSRLALVIGNNAYKDNPLENPVNDARGMSRLFTQAGFTVNTLLDAKRNDMLGAIDLFSEAVNKSEIKLVVFYYAGHGVQLDWLNYLLPVDASVASAADIKSRCVGLNTMLGQLGKAKSKTFIIILDACRNNPFGRAFRMPQQGLSQFDAPNNSLLAYATAPGNVAADGSTANGLYTENLIKELSIKGTRFEDALKRVRTSVRIASRGEQVPWESTSLESDVFLFKNSERKLSGAESEAAIEAEIASWMRIKSSRNLDDLAVYLRAYPNGRFSEIVQYRVADILAEEKLLAEEKQRKERSELLSLTPRPAAAKSPAPVSAPSPQSSIESAAKSAAPAPASPRASGIELGAGKTIQILRPSSNPYSAGTFPLNRFFSVGDKAEYRQSDLLTNVEEPRYSLLVTAINREESTVEFNNGARIVDVMGNIIKNDNVVYDSPLQFFPAELQVGKKWKAISRRRVDGTVFIHSSHLEVARREKVIVPAGEFDSFLLLVQGFNLTVPNGFAENIKIWMVPGLNFNVKLERIFRNSRGEYKEAFRRELISMQQQIFKPPVNA